MSGIIAAFDGTKIYIFTPPDTPALPEFIFVDRRGKHALNVQHVCIDMMSYDSSTHYASFYISQITLYALEL